MELEIYWLQFAENKLVDIYDYYKDKASSKTAKKLVNGIVDATINLKKQPKIGQVEISLANRKREFRFLVHKNYKIIYWVNFKFNRVEIANIFDTRQDPNKINETK